MRAPFLAALVVAAPALAVEPADRAAIRDVIERQIDAFRRDDAAAAYAFASPGIRRMFPDQDIFLRMVRENYPAVHRPGTVLFGELKSGPNGPEQEVRLTDGAGNSWVALYHLEQQPNGAWLISGCIVRKAPEQPA